MILDTFYSFIKLHPRFFIINCILMSLVPINEVFISRLYGRLFDAIQKNTFTLNHFYVILGTMVFLQLGFAYSDYFNSKQMTQFQQFCKVRFLRKTFNDIKNYKKEPNPTDVFSKILRTQHILADWYGKIFSYLIPICLQLFITVGYLMTIDFRLGLFLLVVLIVFAVFLSNSTNICNKNNTKLDEQLTTLNDTLGDVLVNYLSVHKEQSLDVEINILNGKFRKYQGFHNDTIKCSIKYRLLLSSVIIIFLTVFVNRCYKLMKTKQIQNAVFYSMFMILANLISNMVYMIDLHRDMIFDWGLIKNSGFDYTNDKMIKYNCVDNLDKNAVLEIKNVDFKYPNKSFYVIKNLNLKVYKNERLAITGHIGTGKSTLVKMILQFMNPMEGSIYLNQECIFDIPTKQYFKKVGFMPQNCLLFKRNIIDNITYDNNHITENEIIYTIKKFNLMKHFKNGLNVSSDTLSGGQRQLVWFLRIYFKQPELIILDEPTSSLDKETKDLFIFLMDTLMKDKTIIIITHDQYLLKHVSRVVDMKNINQKNSSK